MPIFSNTGGTMPSLSSSSAASRWTGNSSGLPCSEASWLARWTASCALTVNLSQRMGMADSLLFFVILSEAKKVRNVAKEGNDWLIGNQPCI